MSKTENLHDIGGGGALTGTVVRRVDNGNGTFSIHLSATSRVIYGHGNTRPDAAKHLADQLREVARLIEAQEGVHAL